MKYQHNSDEDITKIAYLFSAFRIIEMNDRIKQTAIKLGRAYKMKTPDCIIAATGLQLDIPIVTNDSDFFKVPELTTIDFAL